MHGIQYFDPIFLRKAASFGTGQLLIFTYWSPKAAGVALDVAGRQLVQLIFFIPTLVEFFCRKEVEAGSAALVVVILHLEPHLPP